MLFSYNSSALFLRNFIPLAQNMSTLSHFSILKRFKHQDILSESYKEIQRSSSEKAISAKIVG